MAVSSNSPPRCKSAEVSFFWMSIHVSNSVYDPDYWYDRARKMRTRARGIDNAESRRSLLKIADEYQRIGSLAERNRPPPPADAAAEAASPPSDAGSDSRGD